MITITENGKNALGLCFKNSPQKPLRIYMLSS